MPSSGSAAERSQRQSSPSSTVPGRVGFVGADEGECLRGNVMSAIPPQSRKSQPKATVATLISRQNSSSGCTIKSPRYSSSSNLLAQQATTTAQGCKRPTLPILETNDERPSVSKANQPGELDDHNRELAGSSRQQVIASSSESLSIIPSLSSSHLVFSSIMTTTQTSTKTKTTHRQSAKSPAQVVASQSKNQIMKACATIRSGHNNRQANDIELKSKQFMGSGQTGVSSAGQAVAARLMDMGKRLLDAARDGQVDHVRQLVVGSGAPFTSDWLGTTALHLAAQYCHPEIAEILLRGGVNRDARTKLERTALHLAAQSGCLEVVDMLLIHGSDVNARDMLKMTPLHWAVERGHLCVAKRLLLGGADLEAKSKFQLTPMDIARDSKSHDMVNLFKSWRNKNEAEIDFECLRSSSSFSNKDILDVIDYDLSLEDSTNTGRASLMLDIDEPYDLVELEWNTLEFEPDFFLTNDEEGEPKVEYLRKVVEELQKENRQLRQRVEQLSTS